MAAEFGNQPARIVSEARERARSQERRPDDQGKAQEAVSYAKASIFEREAVSDERGIMRDALRRGMGETTYAAVRAEFDARQTRGEFRQVEGQKHDTGRGFTTPETIANERANVSHVMRGQNIIEPIMTRDQAAEQAEMRHFDHGYAVTSHSSQGLTTGRIIANMDGETARSLVNTRLAYVAISRASEDARIYTNDAATIGQRLATDITKTAAVEFRPPVERTHTSTETERHHAPIREALEPEDAAQFKWKGETGTVHTYQHTETGRNIHIDSKGQFYSQDGKQTSQDAALDHAMPIGRAHSQNELENSLGLGL